VASNPDRVYWDSCTYLDFLEGSHPLAAIMQMIHDDWKANRVTMVTSTLTIAEVLYVKCGDPSHARQPDPTRLPDIEDLFAPRDSLLIVEVDRSIAEEARRLHWDHGIKPKDAVHVASALKASCPLMHTTDTGLQGKSGQVGGAPVLRIEAPSWIRQLEVSMEIEPGAFTSLVDPSEPEPPG
jgi:predicted nucleic acid-binding protein